MPTSNKRAAEKSVQQVADELGLYPVEAFDFVQRGFSHAHRKVHGSPKGPHVVQHITGQDVCGGLRELALSQWGLLAPTVLRRWNVTSTLDFGRIIFAMVNNGLMSTSEQDSIEDFRNVYDFRTAFEAGYRIESKA